jgi:hypothetical protein
MQNVENQKLADDNLIRKFSNDEVNKILLAKYDTELLEDRLDVVAMSQMFSFWLHVQEVLLDASAEIKKLKQQIKELEEKNGK